MSCRCLATGRLDHPQSLSQVQLIDAIPLKVHESSFPNFSSYARALRSSAKCWLSQCHNHNRISGQQHRARQHGRDAATKAAVAHKLKRRMHVRLSVGRDTLLCGGPGNSPGGAGQVRCCEGGHLS